jgi:hemin uptake protein HemP
MSSIPVHRLVPGGNPPNRAPKTASSTDLLGEQGQLRIVHKGEQYILRLTRLGKLILTK